MDLAGYLKVAWRTIWANKSRAVLTMLGIIIGISSFILVNSLGAGAQSLIFDQIERIGSNLIGIMPGASEEDSPPASVLGINITTLKKEDIEAIGRELPQVEAAAPYVRGSEVVSYSGDSIAITFYGTVSQYPKVQATEVEKGRFFTVEEERGSTRVIVLGSEAAKDLFAEEDPIGQRVKIGSSPFQVIGVMKERGATGFENFDNVLFMPISTAQNTVLGIHYLSMAHVKVKETKDVAQTIEEVKRILRERHRITDPENDDFTVSSTEEALSALESVTDALKMFLAAIAAMSLLVGGVGIMNIMYVSVSERTYEVGLRKSVGAKNKDILTQFLVESVLITGVAGVVGIVGGTFVSWLISLVVNLLGYNWDFVISLWSILIAFVISGGVGLFFGIWPARHASSLDPIKALRYE